MTARFFILEPKDCDVEQFAAQLADSKFSYSEIGITVKRAESSSYRRLCYQSIVGHGQVDYERAVAALRSWQQMELGWVHVCEPNHKVEIGGNVVIKAHHSGIWSLNACKVVSVIEEANFFSIANGTLTDHALHGEEQFSVRLQDDGSVLYEIYSFSRPGILATLLYPAVLCLQHRFLIDSTNALIAAIADAVSS